MYEERIMTDPLGSNLFFTYAFAISFLFLFFPMGFILLWDDGRSILAIPKL